MSGRNLVVHLTSVNPCMYAVEALKGAGLRDDDLTKAFANKLPQRKLRKGSHECHMNRKEPLVLNYVLLKCGDMAKTTKTAPLNFWECLFKQAVSLYRASSPHTSWMAPALQKLGPPNAHVHVTFPMLAFALMIPS